MSFVFVLYLHQSAWCLVHSRYLINACWLTDKVNPLSHFWFQKWQCLWPRPSLNLSFHLWLFSLIFGSGSTHGVICPAVPRYSQHTAQRFCSLFPFPGNPLMLLSSFSIQLVTGKMRRKSKPLSYLFITIGFPRKTQGIKPFVPMSISLHTLRDFPWSRVSSWTVLSEAPRRYSRTLEIISSYRSNLPKITQKIVGGRTGSQILLLIFIFNFCSGSTVVFNTRKLVILSTWGQLSGAVDRAPIRRDQSSNPLILISQVNLDKSLNLCVP